MFFVPTSWDKNILVKLIRMVDVLWVIIGVVLVLAGFIGCFLPVIPGPPFNYLALLALQLKEKAAFSTEFMVVWLLITVAVTSLDYIVPILGAKKLGGSKYGITGSALGLLVGLFFFPPLGLILGPIIGAFIGELIAGKSRDIALKAALGSFIGFLTGTLIKLIASTVMTYYFIAGVWEMF